MTAVIDAIFIGGPKTLTDTRGAWQSSIQRERSEGPVIVNVEGIVGDRATQPYHGGPDAALCVHLADHYCFWRKEYGVSLPPGAMGENLTVSNLTEDSVCAGDIVRLGSVLAQVSGPRVPCLNLARHIGRSDWVKLTVRENRTGFYMRVLEPGSMQARDTWVVEQRLDEEGSISRVNDCMYLTFDPSYAHRMLHMKGLGQWWREQASEKLAGHEKHWTARMKEDQHSG